MRIRLGLDIDDTRSVAPAYFAGLDWYRTFLYGKVACAIGLGLTHFVDDDVKVQGLFADFAPAVSYALPSDRARIEAWRMEWCAA